MRRRLWHLAILLLTGAALAAGQSDPVLHTRSAEVERAKAERSQKIQLDVVVRDGQGNAVTGLGAGDFKLFDDTRQANIRSFKAVQVSANAEPATEVLFVLDEVNTSFGEFVLARQELVRYLRRNDGRLPMPVRILLLRRSGMQVLPRPSQDGNSLARVVDKVSQDRDPSPAGGGYGALERLQLCVHELAALAENETAEPGRKVLIWLGPGWPTLITRSLGSTLADANQRRYFSAIVELTNRLREARIVVNSVSGLEMLHGVLGMRDFMYKDYVAGVASAKDASAAHLSLKVLAEQTGGLVLGPSNNLIEQFDECLADSQAFYELTFEAPETQQQDQYHALRVVVARPGAEVRTRSGYYNEPQ